MKITPSCQHIKVHQMVCSAPTSGQNKCLLFLFSLSPFFFLFIFFFLREFVVNVTQAFAFSISPNPQLPSLAPHNPLPSHPACRQPRLLRVLVVVMGLANFAHLPLLLVHLLPHNRQLLHATLHGLPTAASTQDPCGAIHVVLRQDAFRPVISIICRRQGRQRKGQAQPGALSRVHPILEHFQEWLITKP